MKYYSCNSVEVNFIYLEFTEPIFGSVPTTPDTNTSEKYRDTNGRCIVIQSGGVYKVLSAKRRAYCFQNIAIEMGGVSRYCSKVSRPRVD